MYDRRSSPPFAVLSDGWKDHHRQLCNFHTFTKPFLTLSKLIYNHCPWPSIQRQLCAFGFMKTGAALFPSFSFRLISLPSLCCLFPFSAIKAANDKNVNHAVRIPLSNAMIRQSDMTFVVVYAKCGVEKKAMRQLPNAPN